MNYFKGLSDHPFLSDEYFLRRNFHTQVTSGNHDTVSFLEDRFVVMQTILILNFCNNLDMFTTRSHEFSQVNDIFSYETYSQTEINKNKYQKRTNNGNHTRSCEGKGDHVDSVVETEFKDIFFILLGDSWQIDLCSRQIHVLLIADAAVVLDDHDDACLNR